jgi:two-component system chemotaxis response regulator CheB
MLQVLICEDSRTYAVALRRMLEYDGTASVAAVCSTAEEAIATLPRTQPNLVTMDLELPGMDGLTAVEEIMSAWPVPILVLSAHVGMASGKAAAALAAGALDALAKDDLDLRDPAGPTGIALRHRVKVLGRIRVIRHPRARLGSRSELPRPTHTSAVIGVCASTGGPQVLVHLLHELPADFPIPVLVVQHIAAGFTDGLANWLDRSVALPVAIGADGTPAAPGVWIAPEGAHLTLVDGLLRLDRQTVAGRHRPAADVLFASLAEAAGRTGVGVVLSGMGSDGAVGAAQMRSRGGLVIAQDQQTAAVFGMPKAAIDKGVDLILNPTEIASYLRRLRPAPLPGSGHTPMARSS